MRHRCFTTGEYEDSCRCRICTAPDSPLPTYQPADDTAYTEPGHPRREPSAQWDYDPSQGEWRWE